MPFTLRRDARAMLVISDDDIRDFDALLDVLDYAPTLVAGELERYLDRHPGHIDALAHLLLCHHGDGTDAGRVYAEQARDILSAAVAAAGDELIPLRWGILDNRPVLRLGRNAVLSAWDAGDWELTDALAELVTALDGRTDTGEWLAPIRQRTPLRTLV